MSRNLSVTNAPDTLTSDTYVSTVDVDVDVDT